MASKSAPVSDANLRSLFEAASCGGVLLQMNSPGTIWLRPGRTQRNSNDSYPVWSTANQRQRHIHCHDNGKAMGPGKSPYEYSINISSTLLSKKKTFNLAQAKTIGEQLGIRWDKFDVAQFRAGLGVELEHGTCKSND
jgi:hypothetical protein